MIYGLDCNSEYCKNDIMKLLQQLTELYSGENNEEICKVLGIDYSILDSDIPINKYYKEEMIYISDNPCTDVRIHLDTDTKLFLDILLLVTNKIVNEKNLIDSIIENWINSILLVTEKLSIETCGKHKHIHIKVGQDTWNNFTNVCKRKGLLVRNGFKMAVFDFLRR